MGDLVRKTLVIMPICE